MTHDNVTDIVERLSYLHVWPQSIASTYADTLTPRQIERLYDVGNVATEAAEEIISLRKQLENAREAFGRQADNMAFILNRVDLPPQWYDKFTRELAEDRKALDTTNAQS